MSDDSIEAQAGPGESRMDYREHPVEPALRAVVETIWTLECDAPPAKAAAPVVPDGRPELIVHFGDAFERWDETGVVRQSAILLAGQLDRPLHLRPTGRAAVLGVRVTPAGAWRLTRVPQHHLTNETLDVAAVDARLAAGLLDLRERTDSPREAARFVSDLLLARTAEVEQDPRVDHLISRLDAPTADPIRTLSEEAGLTRRQVERLFRDQIGLAPTAYRRVRRLQRAMALLDRGRATGSTRPGTEAAIASGYADQAHFVREFRALAGTTPTAHLLRRAALTGVFAETGR